MWKIWTCMKYIIWNVKSVYGQTKMAHKYFRCYKSCNIWICFALKYITGKCFSLKNTLLRTGLKLHYAC